MKNIIFAIISCISMSSAFALTEQLEFSRDFKVEKKPYADKKEKLSNLGLKALAEYEGNYIEINKDIGPSTKFHPLVFMAKYTNDLPLNDSYDKEMMNFVKKIQKENNLNQTGVLDPVTWFSVYDQPVEWKASVIEQAKENWELIIQKHANHKNKKMIVVNIPSMKLFLYEKDDDGTYNILMESKVIVGTFKTQTPIKDFEIIALKYNPTWTPTNGILERNLYKEDGTINKEWLEKYNLSIYDENGSLRSIDEIDKILNPKFVQPLGEKNALGNLKFETTSKDHIFLHDTNDRGLFKHNNRMYSSGCIRVSEYLDLASLISNKSLDFVSNRIEKKETSFTQVKRVPVYIDYSQVRFIEPNKPVFYPDIYSKNED